ncbi:MAG TPA: hypothetical protein VLH09_06155, partial [Bryobacteraceae bacterium]|nr:hypothetical protein [Bryobacteraceae bacterium]
MAKVLLALLCCHLLISAGCNRAGGKNAAAVSEIVLAGDAHRDRILRGVYPGKEGWRWTAPVFAFALDPPPAPLEAYLEMDFAVPHEIMDKAAPVVVVGKVNGEEVIRSTYHEPGRSLLACQVPARLLTRRPAEVEFSVDRWYTDHATSRPHGLVVVSVAFREHEQ